MSQLWLLPAASTPLVAVAAELVAGYHAISFSTTGAINATAICPQSYVCPGGVVSQAELGMRRLAQAATSATIVPCPDGLWTQLPGATSMEQCCEFRVELLVYTVNFTRLVHITALYWHVPRGLQISLLSNADFERHSNCLTFCILLGGFQCTPPLSLAHSGAFWSAICSFAPSSDPTRLLHCSRHHPALP